MPRSKRGQTPCKRRRSARTAPGSGGAATGATASREGPSAREWLA